jgi:hypothetical protein
MTMRRGQHTSGVLRAMDALEAEHADEVAEEKAPVQPE